MKQKIKFEYIFLLILTLFAFFLRTYRQDQLLGFYYDQGRDAFMAQRIISLKNIPAIGPTTGIEGLHLGPFWYYLITPGYFLSSGNPVIAAACISFLEVLTIPVFYYTIKKFFSTRTAIVFALIWSFSHYIIRSSRWFSNPSPIPLFTALIVYLVTEAIKNKKVKYWPIITFLLGLSLQLEAASAVFFIPTIITIILINLPHTKTIFTLKNLALSFSTFLLTLLPQIAFEIKNNFITVKTLLGFLTGQINSSQGKSWSLPGFLFAKNRLLQYYKILFTKLDTNLTIFSLVLLFIFIFSIILLLIKHRQNKLVQINLIWLFLPLFLLLFFVGNYGQLYDYYLTGFFVSFIFLFSTFIDTYRPGMVTVLVTIIFASIFINGNMVHLKNYLIAGADGPTHITLGNQKQAIEEVCKAQKPYQLKIYVPPVIPYSYQYLLDYYFKLGKCNLPLDDAQSTIYTISEVDLQIPQRQYDWLNTIDTYSVIEDEIKFGGITVQRRTLYEN